MVEEYYRTTLDKWQSIAAGQQTNTTRSCGFCSFLRTLRRNETYTTCMGCPVLVVWPEVGNCIELPEVERVQEPNLSAADLKELAGKVVVLLEENKEALIEAMREIERTPYVCEVSTH